MQGNTSPVGLKTWQCPKEQHLPNDPATVSGVGMLTSGDIPLERLLANDVYPVCSCTPQTHHIPPEISREETVPIAKKGQNLEIAARVCSM